MSARVDPRLRKFAQEMRNTPTPAEGMLWHSLRNSQLAGLKFIRQIVIGSFICDFVCGKLKLVIEIDGNTHVDREKDDRRDRILNSFGYRVLRFTNYEIRSNLAGVLQTILMTLKADTHPLSPSLEGRGS